MKVLTIAAPKGGTGKSNTTALLAVREGLVDAGETET